MLLLIDLSALALIGFIIWWFWLYKDKATNLDDSEATLIVDQGVYQPSSLKISAGKPIQLTFIRKDASPCAEMVIFPELEISQALSLDKPVKITLPALAKGEYEFHCQMKMYRGKLFVE